MLFCGGLGEGAEGEDAEDGYGADSGRGGLVGEGGVGLGLRGIEAYTAPMLNTIETPILRVVGILSFHSTGMGSRISRKSRIRLKMAMTSRPSWMLPHLPLMSLRQ